MNPNQSVKLFQLSFESGKPIWYNSKQAYLLLPLFFFFWYEGEAERAFVLNWEQAVEEIKNS